MPGPPAGGVPKPPGLSLDSAVLIPFGTDRSLRRPRLVTPVLIGLNLAVFLAFTVAQRYSPDAAAAWGDAGSLRPYDFRPWNLVTYAFLHEGWLHLLGNMLILWVFGPNLEDRFGRPAFLAFYLGGGAAAGGLHALFEPSPVIGASGAIAAVTGAYAVLFPGTMVRCFVFFFVIGVFSIPAIYFIGIAVMYDLIFQGLAPGDQIARLAHIGGYAFGAGLALGLRAGGALAPDEFDLFSRWQQAQRRRAFAEAAHMAEQAANKPADPASEALANARAGLTRLIADGNFAAAAPAYADLLTRFPSAGVGATTLPRRQQRDLANGLLAAGSHALAADAYERFARVYPDDPEAPQARVMLALIASRYLADAARGGVALQGLDPTKLDAETRAVFETLTARRT